MAEVLQFSGGLDSLACLVLLHKTPGLVVLTTTTDGEYPERQEYLRKVAGSFPTCTFVQVYGYRDLAKYGQPVDVVPLKFTRFGAATQRVDVRYQPYYECCNRGIWQPTVDAMKHLGATTIYRGQRKDDQHQAPIADGYVSEGVTYRFPIADWSRAQVCDLVETFCPELIPEYYKDEGTSRDCWDCTAYLNENDARIKNLPAPRKAEVVAILNRWHTDVTNETRW